jgi:mannitol/fructose-specific phosphotransferase system IIA component (Ntr-type)
MPEGRAAAATIRSALPRTVVVLGLVSLLNDAASEMITPLLPIFLTATLGAGPAIVGFVEGLADLLPADSVALDVVASGPAEGQSRGSWGPAEAGRPPTGACPTVGDGYVAARWELVVDRAGALLLAAGAVWPSYVEAMKDMIRLYGPYVVVAPGAALLHAGPDMGSKRLRFSLVVLREPVVFGHESNDPVGVALAFSAIDHATHVRAVGQAISLLANGEALSEIRAASTVEAALAAVRKWSSS